jgi:hypothetical protein
MHLPRWFLLLRPLLRFGSPHVFAIPLRTLNFFAIALRPLCRFAVTLRPMFTPGIGAVLRRTVLRRTLMRLRMHLRPRLLIMPAHDPVARLVMVMLVADHVLVLTARITVAVVVALVHR